MFVSSAKLNLSKCCEAIKDGIERLSSILERAAFSKIQDFPV